MFFKSTINIRPTLSGEYSVNKKIILSGPSLEDILNGNYPKRIKRDAAFALASSCFGKREEVRVNGVHVSILPYKDEETRERFPKAA